MRLLHKHIAAFIAVIFIILVASVNAHAFPADNYAAESVLAKGRWVKIKVSENGGIQHISPSTLKSWGFSNASSVKIFGYGGAPISLVLNDTQIDDLVQVPVLVNSGHIYFHAQGVTSWRRDALIDHLQYQHPYSTEAFYFVTDRDDIDQLAISSIDAAPLSGGNEISTYTARTFHEKELISPAESGTYMLGEDMRFTTVREVSFDLAGYIHNTPVKILTSFGSKIMGSSGSTITIHANEEAITSEKINSVESGSSVLVCSTRALGETSLTSNKLSVVVQFTPSGTVTLANLDYITVNYTAKIGIGRFRTTSSTSTDDVILIDHQSADSDIQVWDITTPHAPFAITGDREGQKIRFSPAQKGAREYIAFSTSLSAPSPQMVAKVANQNLHGEPTPDMIIISPAEFMSQAQRIASLHQEVDSMRVLVVDEDKVFNEFSSGTPDIMAYRKMAKMFFDRGEDSSHHRLGYLLLFGRGTYDNRRLSSTIKALKYPMLLTWQTDNGLTEIDSYSTDDILGILADGSGSNMAAEKMDIAVGRMPVKSTTEAKNVVDKLYSYVTKHDFGTWKNNIMVIADDMNNAIHMEQADAVIDTHKRYGGESYVYNRIYLDAYQLENSGSGRAFPEARRQMFQKLDEGVLYLNYIGHSGNYAWTGDGLLTFNDINSMYLKHYPLMLTASCEFTRLDKAEETGGETLFLNPRGGAIALFSTARQVYITDNGTLNKSIARFIFARNSDGQHYRIGDILRLGKNEIGTNTNKLKYFLVGDPALRLAYPTYGVNLESINGKPISHDNMPVFQARQSITLRGRITDSNGNTATHFNGAITPTLYDIEQYVETHGYSTGSDEGKVHTYYDRSNKLSIAKDSVINGEFTVTVAIPSEINAPSQYDNYTPAMLNFYASSDEGIEANGNNEQFYIYGYDSEAITDTIGPAIELFALNSTSFRSGDDVNESPLVMARILDENGINLSNSGIGHQMTLLLDNSISFSDVAAFYTPDFTHSGNKGTINYSLDNLAEGPHTLRLKVWDTFNNSSEQTISFNVIKGLKPVMSDVYAVGNPATTDARFFITHNRPDALITVSLYVYDLMGRLVWSTTESGKSDMFTSFPITWNLTDLAGRRVPRGIYIYKAGISTDGIHETTKAKKIAVAAQ